MPVRNVSTKGAVRKGGWLSFIGRTEKATGKAKGQGQKTEREST